MFSNIISYYVSHRPSELIKGMVSSKDTVIPGSFKVPYTTTCLDESLKHLFLSSTEYQKTTRSYQTSEEQNDRAKQTWVCNRSVVGSNKCLDAFCLCIPLHESSAAACSCNATSSSQLRKTFNRLIG